MVTRRVKRPGARDFFEGGGGSSSGGDNGTADIPPPPPLLCLDPAPKKRPSAAATKADSKSKSNSKMNAGAAVRCTQEFNYPFKISMSSSSSGMGSGNDTTGGAAEDERDADGTTQKVVEEETVCRIPVMVTGVSGGKWPTGTTNVRCWYCHHTFDGTPIGMPLRRIVCAHSECVVYFRRHDTGVAVGKCRNECIARGDKRTPPRYVCKGAFCSYACTKAYIFGTQRGVHSESLVLLPLMRKEISGIGTRGEGGEVNGITAAPPIQLLKAYGGSLSIDEFRARGGDQKATVVPEMLVPRNDVIYDTRRQKRAASRQTVSRTKNKQRGVAEDDRGGGSQRKRARMVRTILKATDNTASKGMYAGKGGLDVFIASSVST